MIPIVMNWATQPSDLLLDKTVEIATRSERQGDWDPPSTGLKIYETMSPSAWGAKLLDEESGLLRLAQDPLELSAGERMAHDILAVIEATANGSESALVPTDDGGITLEFTSDDEERYLLFAIPSDGSVRYFTARGPDGFRRAGIITDDFAFTDLARWLADSNAEFSSMGLDLG